MHEAIKFGIEISSLNFLKQLSVPPMLVTGLHASSIANRGGSLRSSKRWLPSSPPENTRKSKIVLELLYILSVYKPVLKCQLYRLLLFHCIIWLTFINGITCCKRLNKLGQIQLLSFELLTRAASVSGSDKKNLA
jgi:hypothetical protein